MDVKLVLCCKKNLTTENLAQMFNTWLKLKGICEKFYANIEAQHKETRLKNRFEYIESLLHEDEKAAYNVYSDLINSCLVWADTHEGHAFWSLYSREWYVYCKFLWPTLKGTKRKTVDRADLRNRPRRARPIRFEPLGVEVGDLEP